MENVKDLNNHEREDISLKELILKLIDMYRYLLSKWVIIVLFGVLSGVLGGVYAYLQPPTYTATTTFVLEGGDGSGNALGQYAGLASMIGIDIGGTGGSIFQGDNILELYKSRSMIEKTLLSKVVFQHKAQMLIDHFVYLNNLRKSWSKEPKLRNFHFSSNAWQSSSHERLQDSLIGSIVRQINKDYLVVAKPDKKLSIIQVDVKCKDEFFAKVFNDLIVENVNDFYIQTKTKKSLENIAIIQKKTDSVRMMMNGAIYSSAAVADATPNLNPTKGVQRIAPMQRSQFNAETNKAILGELVKNLELSKMALLRETPLIQVVDHPVYPLYKDKLGKAKGVILGGIIGGILIVVIMLFRRVIKIIMA
jgi:hypothetical protein